MFRTKNIRLGVATSLLALAIGGCANLNSISRSNTLPSGSDGKVVTVDAKQRHLIMTNGNMKVCAEAAPDAFSALATSASAQGNNSGAQFGLGSSETASTIERTQTINLLRESFYRTCERYMSGAITKTQFVIQSARDQKSMVSILAIEQLTGAYRPRSTIISPGGTSASVVSGEKAAELIKDYNQKLTVAKAARIAADKAVADAASGDCKDAAASECVALKATATAKKAEETQAQTGLDNIVALAKSLISGGTASTAAGQVFQGGGVGATAFDAARMQAVANAVVKIVSLASIDEGLMFCLSVLTTEESSLFDRLTDDQKDYVLGQCLQLITNSATSDFNSRGMIFDE